MPSLTVGDGTVIERAILDKDCRIGRNVRIINHRQVQDDEGPNYVIREGVIVIPKAGQAVSLPELTRFLTDAGLARFKLPERVELVSEFPLSPFGKVSKQTLTKLIAEKLSSSR